ncbi:MAG: zinc ribbon domain-containing protein [Candidatus Hermodarchaeota archaeon]
MAKYCVYCGNPLKETDKYCIICGKPVLTNVSKTPKKRIDQPKEILIEPDLEEDEIEEEVAEVVDVETKSIRDKKTKDLEKPLPFEVKEQMMMYIEYNDIQLNKKILVEKLSEIQNSLNDPRYDVDMDYKNSINVKLEAIKKLIEELKQKESGLEQKMEKPFIVQRIQDDIEKKLFQLKNLTKEYKIKKVDKDSFEALKEKYKQERAKLETERKDLIEGMKLWIKELKLEKAELLADRNLNKGRFSAKEISKEDFTQKDKDFDLKLNKNEIKIKTLEDLIK